MSEHKNWYRRGLFHDVFGFMKTKQVFTRAELMEYTENVLGKTKAEASAVVTILLSPRLTSTRGDCRGNVAAQGHLYYVEKMGRKVVRGTKEPQKFRLRYRVKELEPRCRPPQVVKQKKTEVIESVEAKEVKTVEAIENIETSLNVETSQGSETVENSEVHIAENI